VRGGHTTAQLETLRRATPLCFLLKQPGPKRDASSPDASYPRVRFQHHLGVPSAGPLGAPSAGPRGALSAGVPGGPSAGVLGALSEGVLGARGAVLGAGSAGGLGGGVRALPKTPTLKA